MIIELLNDYKQLAKYLAKMNSQKEQHIGYCGDNAEEIEHTLHEDFSADSFVIAKLDEEIIGAIGLDISEDSAEVWGPFIKPCENVHLIMDAMWNKQLSLHNKIQEFHFFLNAENDVAKQFVTSLHCEYKGQHVVLQNKKETFQLDPLFDPYASSYEARFFEAFKTLHTEAFPNTYYSAEHIVERLNTDNELFLLPCNDDSIKGYVYIEIDKEHHEASIEYIAISPNFQRQGLGAKLLKLAIDRIFSVHNIKKVQLCVSNENESAIKLYKAVGFEELHYLDSYIFINR